MPIPAPFETSRWITRGPIEPVSSDRPMPMLRRAFSLDRPVAKAVAHVCGLGHFELRVNGTKAGIDRFEPGWTNYRKTCLFVLHDVTALLRTGDNALGVLLGHGMHHVGGGKRYKKYKGSFGPPRLLLSLSITFADGSTQTIASDDAWRTADGPITFSCTYGGEDHDAQRWPAGWDSPGFDAGSWDHAIESPAPRGELVPSVHPPVREMKRHASQRVTRISDAIVVHDLEQNFAGVPEIVVRGSAGASVTLRTGEIVDDAGRVSQSNIGSPVSFTYTLRGGAEETWSPRFSYHGFRYIEVESHGDVAVERVTGIETHSSAECISTFECSDPLLNRVHTLIDNAIRSNLQAVLTDCPHREKLGWLEETHLMAPSLLCRYDLASFYRKIARDMRDAQHDDGCVPTIAPQFTRFEKPWDIFNDSPEWGAAIVLAPWHAYRAYGDQTILEENYDAMKRFERYLTSRADEHGIVAYGLGDWYDIGPGDPGFGKLTTLGVTGTATLFECRAALARIATILGQSSDAERFTSDADKTRADFERRYFDEQANYYDRGSQCAQAMPLALGICSTPARREAALAQLVADIRARGHHVSAGDVGFRYVIDALSMHDRDDVIYDMVVAPEPPSYAAQLAAGATTLAEAWDANPTKSLNHFMLGHAMAWLHERLGGIRVDLTETRERRIAVTPSIMGDVAWAKATRVTPLGSVGVNWRRIDGGSAELQLDLPPGVSATLSDGRVVSGPTGPLVIRRDA
jgi:hypothetical protein